MSVSCKCCLLPARGRSLVRKSSIECGVSECHFETSTMSRPKLHAPPVINLIWNLKLVEF